MHQQTALAWSGLLPVEQKAIESTYFKILQYFHVLIFKCHLSNIIGRYIFPKDYGRTHMPVHLKKQIERNQILLQ